MIVSLYSVRVIFNSLGATDYGIQNVVSGFVAMFSFVTGSLSVAIGRFFSIEIGKGNNIQLRKLFSTSIIIMLIISAIMIILVEFIGLIYINYQMNIPSGRRIAANYLLQFSVITLLFNLICVPFDAIIVSYEKMSAYAYISIVDALLKLTGAYLTVISPIDKLVTYSFLLALQAIVIRLLYSIYCNRKLSVCKFYWVYDKSLMKQIVSIAGWDLWGSSSNILKNYGVNLIINIFYPLPVNAARGIAQQVNAAITKFSGGFLTALRPQIVKNYSVQRMDRTILLVNNGTRFSSYLLLLLSMPLMLECHYVLNLWLGFVPEYCVQFVILTIILSISEGTMVYCHNALLMATGKIKQCQLITGVLQLMNIPISYGLLYLGFSPTSTIVLAIIIAIISCFIRVFILSHLVAYSVKTFINEVYLKFIIVSFVSLIVPLLVHNSLDEGLFRFIIVSLVSITWNVLIIMCLGCEKRERLIIIKKIRNKLFR
jgi:Na+-driven multidrug efflux pump